MYSLKSLLSLLILLACVLFTHSFPAGGDHIDVEPVGDDAVWDDLPGEDTSTTFSDLDLARINITALTTDPEFIKSLELSDSANATSIAKRSRPYGICRKGPSMPTVSEILGLLNKFSSTMMTETCCKSAEPDCKNIVNYKGANLDMCGSNYGWCTPCSRIYSAAMAIYLTCPRQDSRLGGMFTWDWQRVDLH